MSTSRSIQVSITHSIVGVCVGATIEAMLPKFRPDASLVNQTFETLVQIGLNGAALAILVEYMNRDDPTHGLPFSLALFEAQPELAKRIESLSAVVKARVTQASQQMVPSSAEV